MAKVWPKRLLVLALVLAIAVCVGAVASAGRRGSGLGAYARVLKATEAAAQPAPAPDPVADCLMAARLLHAANDNGASMGAVDFEALRAYCRSRVQGGAAKPQAFGNKGERGEHL
ncbi:hypothetical protein K9F62_06280 [Desulfovibrio sp. JY]|nr:hypothetical protein K9F62_06280 [Desulfovibrio sp. JY]